MPQVVTLVNEKCADQFGFRVKGGGNLDSSLKEKESMKCVQIPNRLSYAATDGPN